MRLFKEIRKDIKENGVIVTHYEPQAEVKIMSMNLETGKFEEKKVTDFSKHENLKMFKFHDNSQRFKDFWLSDNHSAIVKDKQTSLYTKVTPMDIQLDPDRYFLVQMTNDYGTKRSWIPCNQIDVTLDESKTVGYDFTVEDNYTFMTHDGVVVQDSMAAYFTMTQEGQRSLIDNCHIDNNLFQNFNDELTLSLGHDIVYGIFLLSKKKPEALPKPLYDYMMEQKWDCVNKKRLAQFLNDYIHKDPKNADIINKLVTLGFTISSRYSQTILSFDNIKKSIIPMEKRKELFDKYINKEITMFDYIKEEDKLIDDLKKVCVFTDLIESGSRGSWQQAKQMFCQRGFVTDSSGHIKATPVWKNLTEGLDSKSMFLSCYGVRKGLADVADNTAVSGAFTRGLVYLGLEAKQGSQKKPCNTKMFLRIRPSDERMAKSLVGRYIFNDDSCSDMTRITLDNYKEYVGQDLRLRSPIYCTDKHYCHYCCPHVELDDLEEGETYNVGVVAAEALSEPLTQLTLRQFHTSGAVTKVSDNDSDEDQDIVHDIRGIQRMFSKPDFDIYTADKWVKNLYSAFVDKKSIKMMFYEVLASCLMWAKPNEDEDEPTIHWRLAQDRDLVLVGYNKVPELESFLLGAAFKNFKRKLLGALGEQVGDSIFDRMILGN